MSTILEENKGGDKNPEAKDATAETKEYKKRLELLYRIGKKVGSVSELSNLLDQTLHMTQQTLGASASSVLLIDEGKGELYFRIAEGKATSDLGQIRLSLDSGIAGWVARHGQPAIVNDVAGDQRFNREIDKVTGFVTTSVLAVPLMTGGEVSGVLEVLNKTDASGFNEQDIEVLIPLASMAAVAISNAKLHQTVLDGYKGTFKALVAAIDAKDPYTLGHSQRVTKYAMLAGTLLVFSGQELEALEYGSLLQDIGKIGIPDKILNKQGALTTEERAILRTHPVTGANMLKELPFLEDARKLVLHHHERYDGKGYPDGLKGDEIPTGARLISVADAFDAMTTDRSYRAVMSVDYAINELYDYSGTHFCPVAVEAFVSGFQKWYYPNS
ncbi:HD-GYP domain-containing protein [Chloroflexota bacterium]